MPDSLYFLLPAEEIVNAHDEMEQLTLDPLAGHLTKANNFGCVEPLI